MDILSCYQNGTEYKQISQFLPLDIWKIIFNFLSFKSKIRLISTCKYFRQNLHVVDLYYIKKKYLHKLSTSVLKYSIFKNVLWLNI